VINPSVSVIVPCRNEAAFIGECIGSILRSDYRGPFEVIVADGCSTDGTRAILDSLALSDARVRVVDNTAGSTPIALNLAIAASRGEVILRFDAHASMPTAYMRRTVELLLDSGADNAGGSIRTVARSEGVFAGPIAAALASPFGVGGSSFRTESGQRGARAADTVFGGCWRRDLFNRLGGFNEKLARGQDLEFNLRLRRVGGRIVLDPEIVCDYYARASLGEFWRHNFTNGIWAVLPFVWSEVMPVRPRHLIPLAFVAALALSLALPFPWSIALFAAYAAANLCASCQIALARRKPSYAVLLPFVFGSLHLSYGVGSAWGCVRACLLLSQTGTPKHASRTET
jgi:glycosyltransferase involved in cell wall biosynthesis